jgi:adenosylcobinamide-phosphate synthase
VPNRSTVPPGVALGRLLRGAPPESGVRRGGAPWGSGLLRGGAPRGSDLLRGGAPRALGLLLGVAVDAALGDPRRGHPVAGFGVLAGRLEKRVWAPSRGRGAAYVAVAVGAPVVAAVLAERATRRSVTARVATTAVATWAVLGGRSLAREASAMAALLERGDLPGARSRLSHLAGRDPSALDLAGLARASVESVAENTSDAVVAPLLWGAVAGVPGLVGYRAVNTLDAMVGHRTPRHERFGWAAARLDDVANLLPARVTALLATALAPVVGGCPSAAWRTWRRDAGQHPSPNAGPVEAAFAGALDIRLGGTNVYAGRVEHRGTLGDGPPADVPDLARAVRLALAVDVAAALGCAALALVAGRRPGGPR